MMGVTSAREFKFLGMPTLRMRGTGNLSEFELMNSLDALRDAILTTIQKSYMIGS
jgi:hypothetical protein